MESDMVSNQRNQRRTILISFFVAWCCNWVQIAFWLESWSEYWINPPISTVALARWKDAVVSL